MSTHIYTTFLTAHTNVMIGQRYNPMFLFQDCQTTFSPQLFETRYKFASDQLKLLILSTTTCDKLRLFCLKVPHTRNTEHLRAAISETYTGLLHFLSSTVRNKTFLRFDMISVWSIYFCPFAQFSIFLPLLFPMALVQLFLDFIL